MLQFKNDCYLSDSSTTLLSFEEVNRNNMDKG